MHEYLGTFFTFVKETKSELQPTDDKGNETKNARIQLNYLGNSICTPTFAEHTHL